MDRTTQGEMPFLDHLEELRTRLFRILGAVVVAVGLGIAAVDRFHLVAVLKAPIAPFLPDGKLTVLSPTEPVFIVLKLGFIVGLVLASPIILWQVWAFLSPALYEREKRAIVPSLLVGLLLFLAGAVLAFEFVVPKAIAVLLSIEADAFATMITYDKYFSFVIQIMVGIGLSFELPLVIITLASLGVATPGMLHRFRRYWVVLAFVAGAFLSPGPDVFSMILMTIPLLVLYEVGVMGALVIHRRRRRAAAALGGAIVLLLMGGGTKTVQAQQPPPVTRADSLQDSTRRVVDSTRRARFVRDSAAAHRLGLPAAPTQTFEPPDAVLSRLLQRPGFAATRYRADSAFVNATARTIDLRGSAMAERSGATLEAGSITYRDRTCEFEASRDPRLFQEGKIVVGETVRYDTCGERGVVTDALTSFQEQNANWFVRGNLAVDSSSSRLYAAAKEITSCDLPESHYHFQSKEVKWVSQSTLVARPAILYIRDVPILWIPFLFQDTRQGRRSGILPPQFGVSDVVRFNRNASRSVTGFGYYWAMNDYADVAAQIDWVSNTNTRIQMTGQYNWLDRDLRGNLAVSRLFQAGGGTNTDINWTHNQSFGLATHLTVGLAFSSNTNVRNDNAIETSTTTETIRSNVNLTKQFVWGQVTLGLVSVKTPTNNQTSTTFPILNITPKPLDLSRSITWTPSLQFSRTRAAGPDNTIALFGAPNAVESLTVRPTSKVTTSKLVTDFRLGGFLLPLSIDLLDRESQAATTETVRIPDLTTPDPLDSVTVRRVSTGDFETTVNWDTRMQLPVFFQRTWRLVPSVGISNIVGGPFFVRNRRTGGDLIHQGKRFDFNVGVSPTFFGFFPGFGPIARIRHSLSPQLSFRYAPKAEVSEEFARAIGRGTTVADRTSPAVQVLSFSLNQNFEAKNKAPAGDSLAQTPTIQGSTYRLLSINTSSIQYDFEQAKKPGRTGWITQTITNALQSDLLPGFALSLTHDLWRGVAGTDSAKFEPFLQGLSTSFSITGATFRGLGELFGIGGGGPRPAEPSGGPFGSGRYRPPAVNARGLDDLRARQPFQASVQITLQRTRPPAAGDTITRRVPTRANMVWRSAFSPTRFWSAAYETDLNLADRKFESHTVRLARNLHDWQVSFSFIENANGNFSFSFGIHLIDLPTLRFEHTQQTFDR